MSSRWSYGPEGLREVQVQSRWNAERFLPRWRDLQPLLLRSAGAVGLAGVIVAVVASGGWHSPDGRVQAARTAPVVLHAAKEVVATPAEEAIAASTVVADPMMIEPVVIRAAEEAAPEAEPQLVTVPESASIPESAIAPQPEPASETAGPVIEPEIVTPSAPTAVAVEPSVDLPEPVTQPKPVSLALATIPSPNAESQILVPPSAAPEIDASLREAAKAAVIAAAAAADEASAAEAQLPEATPVEPTATVQTMPSAVRETSPNPRLPERPVSISVAALPKTEPATETDADAPIWNDDADACPRDWVAAYDAKNSGGSSLDCAPAADLVASVAEGDQSLLEEAAAEQAEILAALAPIPRARPEPPADFKPSNPHTTRKTRLSMDWPDEPPPNCGSGKRAKWRFTDRRTGAKEWYCR